MNLEIDGDSSMELSSQLVKGEENDSAVSENFLENHIPAFVRSEIKRLYENLFSTLEKFERDGSLHDVSTYVVRAGSAITILLLLKRNGSRMQVLNEFIKLSRSEIQRFSNYVFRKCPSVSVISFGVIQIREDGVKLTYPYQKINCSEDIVLTLPKKPEDYLLSLGKATRQNINHYRNKLKKSSLSFAFLIEDNEQIDEANFRSIIALNHSRTTAKGKQHGFDEGKIKKLLALARDNGFIGMVTLDGKLCAGTICCRVETSFFLYVLAHDSAYNEYGIGTYCCYLTICEFIRRGGKLSHFMWGREEYKYRLLGVQEDFDSMTIYRSQIHQFLNAPLAIKKQCRGYMRSLRFWLIDPSRRNGKLLRAIEKSIRFLVRLRI